MFYQFIFFFVDVLLFVYLLNYQLVFVFVGQYEYDFYGFGGNDLKVMDGIFGWVGDGSYMFYGKLFV